jgi:FkbM family methyltransferase
MKGLCTAKYTEGDREVEMKFVVRTPREKWRVETLGTKEPATFQWLQSLTVDDTLFDIGANIGVYSIFAAVARGVRVVAFEPEALNYAALCENIAANEGLDERVVAFCLAASNRNDITRLNLSEVSIGSSGHALGAEVGYFLEPRKPAFKQGAVAVRLATLVVAGALLQPTAIKIDVDGFEHEVVEGLGTVLYNVRTLCVEVNPAIPEHAEMVRTLQRFGFDYDPEQVAAATRTEGAFKGVAEYIFTRPVRVELS